MSGGARNETSSAAAEQCGREATPLVLGQEMAASIAHEVNQPLSAIMTYAKAAVRWLQREQPDIAEATLCLQQVVANGRRAAAVVSRIRALAHKIQAQPEAFDISELVDESVSLVECEACVARVTITRVPGTAAGLVMGDRVQIQQVIVNLLINGIQAMEGLEGRLRELRVTCESTAGGMVKVAVEDRGAGLTCDPSRLFEPYFSTKPGGMGMGLAICLFIVECHGGRIAALNNPDVGATVFFTLPTCAPQELVCAKKRDHFNR